jgi:hypothetical protein
MTPQCERKIEINGETCSLKSSLNNIDFPNLPSTVLAYRGTDCLAECSDRAALSDYDRIAAVRQWVKSYGSNPYRRCLLG